MNTKSYRLLAVVDPTSDEQWALDKALAIAKTQPSSEIVAYLCVHSSTKCDEPARLEKVELARHRLWLDSILARYSDEIVPITPLIEWHAEWPKAIGAAAQKANTDLIIKRASRRPRSLGNSDRALMRSLDKRTLLLVKNRPGRTLKKLLVAVDFNAVDANHKRLNDSIMELGKRIRGTDKEIELHSICAYAVSDKFVHPPDMAKTLGIKRSEAHVQQGTAADVIPGMANKIKADLVVLGSVARRGVPGTTIGNTAEKILAGIEADVLVVVEAEKKVRAAA